MRKAFFLMTVSATLVMASCTKEVDNKVFKAETESIAESGKVANSDGSLLWQAGDQVSIYDGASHSAVYAVSEGAGTSSCEFAYSSGSELDEGYYTAVYPAAIRTGASTLNLPATQSSADGSLAGLPLYAQSTSENLKFYNLCGVVRFRLSASSDVSVSSIAVATDRAINGAVTISSSGTSVALSTPSGTSTTTLSVGTPQSIASARDFYIYLPAGSYSTFNITVTASNSTICTKSISQAISVQRGKITTITLTELTFRAGNMVFKAETEPVAENVKVAYSNDSLLWQVGDQISIYDIASHSAVYEVSEDTGTSHCDLAFHSGSDLDYGYYTAVYPAAIRTGENTISLPATQSSVDGSLTDLPMYALSTNNKLMFYNLCGVVRFRLSALSDVSVCSIAVETDFNTNGSAAISGRGMSVALSTPSGTSTTTLSVGTPQSIASARDFYMYLPAGSYSTFNITVTAPDSTIYIRSIPSTISLQRGKITTITLTELSFAPKGAINGLFTINAGGDQVYFSQGNLQYQASTGTWRFATNQYDYIGSANSNISSTYSGWIDLFGWGTSGWNSGANCYQPWSTSNNNTDYYPGSAYTNNLTGAYARADWGINNAISNGGNTPGLWRTLTKDEWVYLFNTRSASTVNGVTNARYAIGTVAGVAGVILFPDSYTHPSGVTPPRNINTSEAYFTGNRYTADNWTAMETAGAVFLPAAGYRFGTTAENVGAYGYYWSSSYKDSSNAYNVFFSGGYLDPGDYRYRFHGRSVRLVRD